MRVGDEKADIIALDSKDQRFESIATIFDIAYLDSLPPQDEEALGPLCQEPGELVDKDVLYFVRLFYPYAHSDTIDRGLYKHFLVLVPGNCERV